MFHLVVEVRKDGEKLSGYFVGEFIFMNEEEGAREVGDHRVDDLDGVLPLSRV